MPIRTNELDLQGLDEIFANQDATDREVEQKSVDFDTNINYDDAIDALKKNIHNSNQLLEKIQDEMNNGNFSARLVEVAGNILNTITQASKEVLSDQNYEDYMEVRRALVQLKDKELDIKQAKLVRQPTNQTNVLVTSREDLLKMLEKKEPRQIEAGAVNVTED